MKQSVVGGLKSKVSKGWQVIVYFTSSFRSCMVCLKLILSSSVRLPATVNLLFTGMCYTPVCSCWGKMKSYVTMSEKNHLEYLKLSGYEIILN